MAFAIKMIAGAECPNGEELFLKTGVVIDTSVFRSGNSGIASYKLPNSGVNEMRFTKADNLSIGGNNHVWGFAFRINDTTPPAATTIFSVFGSLTQIWIAYLETDGDLYLGDTDLTNNTTVTNPFTVDTWHYVEFYWSNTNGGTLLFFVDGVQKGSLVGNFSGTIERWRIINNNASNPSLIINIDDVYIADGATSTTELLGSNFCVSKVYQGDGLTTEGSALNAGSWANTQEFPGNDTNTASYTGTPLSGGTTLTGGSRQGPNGDAALSGTRKCVLGVFRAKRGSGGGTTHKLRLGNNTDGMTDFTIAITTSFVNWWVLSESESVAATFTEYGKMGMSVSGAQDIVMADMYYMLGYVKAAASSDGNFFFAFQ